ncbi:MAG TPA: fumarylacetoacetate hydrolase family protein [Burkholderiales bacterium]|nr:fumarylacetoacetate hydrolase family protein [Burkholderiales bacterium]
MRLVTYHDARGGLRTGAVEGERIVDLTDAIASLSLPARAVQCGLSPAPGSMLHLLCAGADGFAAALRHVATGRPGPVLRETRLAAPVPRPGKIVGIGRNYADHAKETGVQPFERPRLFGKLPSSATGHGATVPRPRGVAKLDFEAELGVVIGAFARDVPRDRALAAVAGYTILNDLSAREFQFDVSPPQTTFAKSMDGFCPMGPWLVTADEIADPQALAIRSYVNGAPMQQGSTADMLFPVDRLVEYISGFMTLEPGDVIATGTPAGSGAFRKPPVWLQPGDRVRIEIERIGVLEHAIGEPA